MAIYENTTYGLKVFDEGSLPLDLEPIGMNFTEKMLIAASIGITVFAAITHPFETFIAVILLALLFS